MARRLPPQFPDGVVQNEAVQRRRSMFVGVIRTPEHFDRGSHTMVRVECSSTRLLIGTAVTAALVLTSLAAVAVAARPGRSARLPKRPSYVVIAGNAGTELRSRSTCKGSHCANGIRFTWRNRHAIPFKSASTVSDRYPPVAAVLTWKNKMQAHSGPLISPWSHGLQLTWNTSNRLTTLQWVGGGPNKHVAYLPKANGLDLFFEGANNNLLRAKWLKKGKPAGTVAVKGTGIDVFWYGHKPPASPFAKAKAARSRHQDATSTPRVALFGRKGASTSLKKSSAPARVNGVEFDWFLNNQQRGQPGRGCVKSDGAFWTSPLEAYAFTTHGKLSSRVNVLTCPVDVTGNPAPYNMVNFAWTRSSSGYTLATVTAAFDNGARVVPVAASLPQPPAGTTGMQMEFHLDNFHYAAWTIGSLRWGSNLPNANGTKVATWTG